MRTCVQRQRRHVDSRPIPCLVTRMRASPARHAPEDGSHPLTFVTPAQGISGTPTSDSPTRATPMSQLKDPIRRPLLLRDPDIPSSTPLIFPHAEERPSSTFQQYAFRRMCSPRPPHPPSCSLPSLLLHARSFSMSALMEAGVVVGAYRFTTLPSLSTRNLPKFQGMRWKPRNPGFSFLR